jgi:hypothetical protein
MAIFICKRSQSQRAGHGCDPALLTFKKPMVAGRSKDNGRKITQNRFSCC